jgi:hypothetical protein
VRLFELVGSLALWWSRCCGNGSKRSHNAEDLMYGLMETFPCTPATIDREVSVMPCTAGQLWATVNSLRVSPHGRLQKPRPGLCGIPGSALTVFVRLR